eukprot:SAG31_NODE_22700_length_519_cov_50.285714_1_plen_62_part_01
MLWDIRSNYYKIGKGTISRGTTVYAGTAWYLPVSTSTVIEAVLSCCMNELLQVNLYIDNVTR